MSKYNEIMEHISLTTEMRARIISNIGAKQKRKHIKNIARTISAAAACTVIAVGAVTIWNKTQMPQSPDNTFSVDSQDMQVGWESDEYDTITELSNAIGIDLHDVDEVLPFEVQERSYAVLFDTIAEINYDGADGENCCIRVGKNTEDISGDYNEYDTVKETEINGATIILKENETLCYLASWIKSGHFYSVSLCDGADEQKMLDIVSEMIGN